MLVGSGTADSGTIYTVGETGGEEKHRLTPDELAIHTHAMAYAGDHSHTVTTFSEFAKINGNNYGGYCKNSTQRKTSTDGDHIHIIQNAGGDKAHENRQPYVTVNRWKRIS